MESNNKHILVVDDDDRIRNLIKEYLKDNNFIVSTASDAEKAKLQIDQFKFDLVVLVVMMPGQIGFVLGAILGSNLFNLLAITGIASIITEINTSNVLDKIFVIGGNLVPAPPAKIIPFILIFSKSF